MADESVLGFTGAFVDPATAAYPLGNGYRWFLPSLMRFNAPDDFSPFGAGGINPYAYCAGDPINYSDPSAHVGEEWSALPGVSHLIESSIRQEWERKEEETSGMGLSAYQETKSNHSGGLFAFNPYHEESSWREKYTDRTGKQQVSPPVYVSSSDKRQTITSSGVSGLVGPVIIGTEETPQGSSGGRRSLSMKEIIAKAKELNIYVTEHGYSIPMQNAVFAAKMLDQEGMGPWELTDYVDRKTTAVQIGYSGMNGLAIAVAKLINNDKTVGDKSVVKDVELVKKVFLEPSAAAVKAKYYP